MSSRAAAAAPRGGDRGPPANKAARTEHGQHPAAVIDNRMDNVGPRYYAVFARPRWKKGVAYSLLPCGAWERELDAVREMKAASAAALRIFRGTDWPDSSWALSHALPAECLTTVRTYCGSEADSKLRALNPTLHRRLRTVAESMLEHNRERYLDILSRLSTPHLLKALHRLADTGHRFPLDPQDSDENRQRSLDWLEEWLVHRLGHTSQIARVIGHDKRFKRELTRHSFSLLYSPSTYGRPRTRIPRRAILDFTVQAVPAPLVDPGLVPEAPLYLICGRLSCCGFDGGEYSDHHPDVWSIKVHGVARKPDLDAAVTEALVSHAWQYEEGCDGRVTVRKGPLSQSLDGLSEEDTVFFEDPVDSDLIFGEGRVPLVRESKGLKREEAVLERMGSAGAPHNTPFFVHAARRDAEGTPVAQGYLYHHSDSDTFEAFLAWAEPVAFHPSRAPVHAQ